MTKHAPSLVYGVAGEILITKACEFVVIIECLDHSIFVIVSTFEIRYF